MFIDRFLELLQVLTIRDTTRKFILFIIALAPSFTQLTLGFLPACATRTRGAKRVLDYRYPCNTVDYQDAPRGVNLTSTSLSSFLGEASFLSYKVFPSLKTKINSKLGWVLGILGESKWCRPYCSEDSLSGSYHNDLLCRYPSAMELVHKILQLTFLLAIGMARSLHPLHMGRLYIEPSTWRASGPTSEPVVSDTK